MTYLHPCNTFTVTSTDGGYRATCSCGWSSEGWTTHGMALAALAQHLHFELWNA